MSTEKLLQVLESQIEALSAQIARKPIRLLSKHVLI